jgi:Arc/MetJ family transcription regulator
MRTTLDIDEELLGQAMRSAGLTTKRSAVEEGLRLLVAREARRRLARLAGTVRDARPAARRRTGRGR